MTIQGRTVDKEFIKLLAQQSQRLVVILGLLAFLAFKDPQHVTAWSLFSAAVVALLHSTKAANGSHNGKV